LLTVARRRLIDHWRAESTRERGIIRLRTEAPIDAEAPTALADTVVDEVLATPSSRYRAALTVRCLDDSSVSEVADALDPSYTAAESLLTRARSAFGTAYREYT